MQTPAGNMSDLFMERSYYRSGQLRQERPLVNGQPQGFIRTWHKNGMLALEEPYQEGKRHGTSRQWDASGKLLGSSVLNQGTGTHREWWDNGQLKVEISILDGGFHGISRQWLRDGTLAFKAFFIQGSQFTPDQYHQKAPNFANLPKDADGESVELNTPELSLKVHTLFVQSLLSCPNQAELRKWLTESEAHGNKRSLGNFTNENLASEFAEALYRYGAVSVIAADLYSNVEGDEFCDCLLINLPKELKVRTELREFCGRSSTKFNAVVQPDSNLMGAHLSLYWG